MLFMFIPISIAAVWPVAGVIGVLLGLKRREGLVVVVVTRVVECGLI